MDFNDTSVLPSYLVAANTHDIANGSEDSFLDAATLGTGAVIGSAVVQTLNILPTVGSWFGGDFEQIKTQEVLQSFDEDLGNYYSRHQEGVDALGFALSTIVPGTGGIKVLRSGQKMLSTAAETGAIGGNLAAATGLLAPSQPKLLAAAVEAAVKPNSGFPVWNSQTIKAIAQGGFVQGVLEGAAFETAVAATMYNSPVLEKQDFGDLVSNITHGALVFGALGTAVSTAKTYFSIKNAARVADKEAIPFNAIVEIPKSESASSRLLNYFDQLHNTPEVPLDKWVGDEAYKVSKFQGLREGKIRQLQTDIRSLAGEISSGDEELATSLYNRWMKMDLQNVESKLFSTEQFSRLGTLTKHEKEVSKLVKNTDQAALMEGNFELPNKSLMYVKIAGSDLGKVTTEAPAIVNIADRIQSGRSYTKEVASYGQRPQKAWNPLDTNPLESEARYVTAAKYSFKPDDIIAYNDIPYLQAAYLRGIPEVTVKLADGTKTTFDNSAQLFEYLVQQKKLIASTLSGKKHLDFSGIAKIADVNENLLRGTLKGELADNVIITRTGKEFDTPQWAKVVKNLDPVKDVDGNVMEGLLAIKQQQKLFEQAADRATAPILGESSQFFRLADSDVLKANRSGSGGGFFSSMNENYGTLASKVQFLGLQTSQKIRAFQESTREALNPTLYKLSQNQAAAIELSVINDTLRAVPEGYTFSNGALRPWRLVNYERLVAAGKDAEYPILAEGVPLSIPIKNQEVAEFIQLHTSKNADRIEKLGAVRTNQGVHFNRNPEVFYAIPPNTKDYPHFAFVVDDSIGGYGHSKMLYAATAEDLESQIAAVRSTDSALKIYTKNEAENYYKSIGQYEFERTLTDTTFDAGLKRKGVSAKHIVSTDPQKIVSDFLEWHLQRDSSLVREAVLHQNEAQVATLRKMGEAYSGVKESHFTKLDPLAYIEMQGSNPYADYTRTMLGLSTKKDYPYWTSFNDMLDRKVSGVFNGIKEIFNSAKSPADLTAINKALQDAGYESPAYTAMVNMYANHTAPRGALTSFVAKANSLMSISILGLDPINAVTNVVGSTVLRTTELTSLLRNIAAKDAVKAGELAYIKVPGTGDSVLSPVKMIATAMKDFHSSSAMREELKAMGIISSRADQTKWVLDNLALTGKESVQELDSKINTVFTGIKKAAAKGEVLTGNKLAEEFNRFVSAHVAKQITDLAVEQKLISPREAWAYVNTFVNRAEGNYLASQRPGVFQGPLGQAVGLFQTYQFNLLQQLFRHVGEGSAKDIAIMAGLQSSIFGVKGLPAFDAINTHIIGTASGNTEHRDLYSTVFGAAGKEAGEWLMYGLGSNALGLLSPDMKFNLYTRGDINPRNVTLLPTNPANIPFVQASVKLYSSMKEAFGKIASGGDVWGSMLQGIEHAGVNRPLAGLAQSLQAFNNPKEQSFSTSSRGNVVASNDFLSLTNVVRIAGAKPLDEAYLVDRAYNMDVYAAKDTAARNRLGEAIKTTVIAGKNPSAEQLEEFAYKYVKAGGKQEKFNQFVLQQYKNANTSQVNKIAESLRSPFSQSMQTMMGGTRLKDFTHTGE